MHRAVTGLWVPVAVAASGCGEPGEAADRCGPRSATVARVVDGDTVELVDGTRVRYLLVDAPESTTSQECWGEEARRANRELVEGREIALRYDEECRDRYGRLLAFVSLGGREINALLVERGHACVLQIPPNGAADVKRYRDLERAARAGQRGLFGACDPLPC